MNSTAAVNSSSRNDVVGVGGAVQIPRVAGDVPSWTTFSFTLGIRTEQSPYSGELAAMAYALRRTLTDTSGAEITVLTSSKSAALAVQTPRQQSGQDYIRSIYDSAETLRAQGNTVNIQWLPAGSENELLQRAKEKAQEATKPDVIPEKQFPAMRSTTTNLARLK